MHPLLPFPSLRTVFAGDGFKPREVDPLVRRFHHRRPATSCPLVLVSTLGL